MSENKAPYRQVGEGCGGTFRFNINGFSTTGITHIGTTDCLTCVGVYLPIDQQRCFVAHIDGFMPTSINTPSGSMSRKRRGGITASEGQRIRAEVNQRLGQHAENNGWSKKDVLNCMKNDNTASKAVIVCPKMEGNWPGSFIVQGINDFLGPQVDLWKFCRTDARGFVVDQCWSTQPFFIQYDDFGRGKDLRGHEPVKETFDKKDWEVRV